MDIWKLFVLLRSFFSLILRILSNLYQQYLKYLLTYNFIFNMSFIILSFLFNNPFMYHYTFNYIILY